MKAQPEVLRINDREVTITNPGKLFFAEAGVTKLDLVQYYLAVADGALRGVRNRPMALKRFVNGAAAEAFFQKRAPDNRPDWLRIATLSFPSGRTADEIVLDDAAGLAWIVNLGCLDLNPHPVRADDLDHPDELRVDLDPVPGVEWAQIRDVAMVAKESLEAVGLIGWPKTSGSRGIHINVRIERRWGYPEVRRAALALARDVERRAPSIATSKWWKEERHGVFLDYNQNAKDRTVASAYSVRPLPDARVSTPLTWEELPTCDAAAFTVHTVPARYAAIGDPGDGIDEAVGSLDALLELSERDSSEGLGDAPWPPNYRKQEGEPPRVQPSRQRRATADYDTPEAEADREKARAAMEKRFGGELEKQAAAKAAVVAKAAAGGSVALVGSVASAGSAASAGPRDGSSGRSVASVGPRDGSSGPATKPTPTGRRRSSIPVIEISRAKSKDEALEGLERWKVRWPAAAGALEPADVLVDGMRGRSSLWYRVRVNLTHVAEVERPPQEALDPDYDPWVEYEFPDRAGQRERAPRKPRQG